MTDAELRANAQTVYETLCHTLNGHEWNYDKDEENLVIECSARGDDLSMPLRVEVDAGRQLVILLSILPFTVPDDKRLDTAVAVSHINNMLVNGSFDFNIKNGKMVFRMTTSFIESDLSDEVFTYLVFCSCQTVDEYNDKLFMLAEGLLPLEKFLSES